MNFKVTDAPDAIELDPKGASIELKDVSFHYDPNVPVLKNVSFTVNSGEKVAIVSLNLLKAVLTHVHQRQSQRRYCHKAHAQ